MQLLKLLCHVPWLITLGGIAPLSVVLVTGVEADMVSGTEVVLPSAPAKKDADDLELTASQSAKAWEALRVVDLVRQPDLYPRAETPAPPEIDENPSVDKTLGAYKRVRLAERFAGRYVELWNRRWPWEKERKSWEAQVEEHKAQLEEQEDKNEPGVAKLTDLTTVAENRIAALKGLEENDVKVQELELFYADKDYLGAREIGDQLKIILKKMLAKHQDDRDVPKVVTPWLTKVTGVIDSATFQAAFNQWKSRFDVLWPRLQQEDREFRREWENASKPPGFELSRDKIGQVLADELDEKLVEVRRKMVVVNEKLQEVSTRLQKAMGRVEGLYESVPAEKSESLKRDASGNYSMVRETLKIVRQRYEAAARFVNRVMETIESHDKAFKAWDGYKKAPRQKIPERFEQVVGLLAEFPEETFPTGMIRERLQCDMMDWLRGLFEEKTVYPDATVQEAQKKGGGWYIGRFENREAENDYFRYDYTEMGKDGKLKPKSVELPSFRFHGKKGEFPRQPKSNGLIKQFNESVKRVHDGFDDGEQWMAFEKMCRGFQAALDSYVKLRGGPGELRINKTLSFDSQISRTELLVGSASHLKALFPR